MTVILIVSYIGAGGHHAEEANRPLIASREEAA
jgi:hypothetical protein